MARVKLSHGDHSHDYDVAFFEHDHGHDHLHEELRGLEYRRRRLSGRA